MKIGIVGSRTRDSLEDWNLVGKPFHENYKDGDEIISGGCSVGADRIAESIAISEEVPIKIYHAQWKKYGKYAGPVRNEIIAKESDILIACYDGKSRGTNHTIDKFKRFHPKGKLIIV